MNRTDIHEEQLMELKRLNGEQMLYDLNGVRCLLSSIAHDRERAILEYEDGIYLLERKLGEINKRLHTYLDFMGEI